MKEIDYIKILKAVPVFFFLVIPPWFALRKHIKDRINKYILILLFVIYIILTFFVDNFSPFIAALLAIHFVRSRNKDSQEAYYLRPLGRNRYRIILYTLGFKVFASIINSVYILFLQGFNTELKSQEIIKMFANATWFQIGILSIMTVIIAPILEEFIFRHILYRGFVKKTSKVLAALITSAIFTFIHYNIAGSISFFILGLYNCYLYEEYGYRAAVANHFVFNLVSTAAIIYAKFYGIALPQ